MGNSLVCFSPVPNQKFQHKAKPSSSSPSPYSSSPSTYSWLTSPSSNYRSSRKQAAQSPSCSPAPKMEVLDESYMKQQAQTKPSSSPSPYSWLTSPYSNYRSSRKQATQSPSCSPAPKMEVLDEAYIKQQAQIASMLYHQHMQQQNNTDILSQLDRSVSTKNPPKSKYIPKKSRSVSGSNPLSLQLSKQDFGKNEEEQSKNHFVLVHGGGFGAWCWYKMIALLKESNCQVDAIDLTGSGLNFCDINTIENIQQYSKPLTDFLENLPDDQKVILVGHDLGGACVSYAMEMHPTKISKAVFVAATMLSNGQSALDIFSQQVCFNDLNVRAQKFVYANGKGRAPTAMAYDQSLVQDLLFSKTPSKDIALASISMGLTPFTAVAEKLSLSAPKYGSVPRFYIKTDDEDFAIPLQLQEAMIESNPPAEVFELKGSDHSPFFSRPQALLRFLLQISSSPIPRDSTT